MTLINKEDLIAEYDKAHQGPPGEARKLMVEAAPVEAMPVEWIEAEIKYLKAANFEFTARAANHIEAMLKKWRGEQETERDHS